MLERIRSRSRVHTLGALVLAIAAGLFYISPAQAGFSDRAESSDTVLAWAAEWMVDHPGDYSEAEAIAIAKQYNVIAAQPWTFADHVDAMYAANPDLQLLAYVNGPFESWRGDYPESWYAHDASGRRITAVRFGNNLMNPHTSQWRNEIVRLCQLELDESGYNGCFLDTMGNGILMSDYLSAYPVDPRTGTGWDLDQWTRDTARIASHLRDALPGVTVALNGLGSGPRYFDKGAHELAGASHLGMAESFIRHPTAAIDHFPNVTRWKQNVDMIAHSEAQGTGVLAVTKVWTDGAAHEVSQWYRYTFGSFLLGSGDSSQFFFVKNGCAPPCSNPPTPLDTQPQAHHGLGTPEGSYVEARGWFERSFSEGMVVVNPHNDPVTNSLGAKYRTQDGATVTSITVGAHDAAFLEYVGPLTTPTTAPPTTAAPTTTAPPTTAAPTTTAPPATAPPATEPPASTPPATLYCDGKPATIVGTDGDDVLVGTGGDDVIVAGSGNDYIEAKSGNDTICAGDGNDVIHAGNGWDRIFGEGGNDVVYAGNGNDYIHGAGGDDVLRGEDGDDTIEGHNGNDKIVGNQGNDTMYGHNGTDSCNGGGGTTDLAFTCELVDNISNAAHPTNGG